MREVAESECSARSGARCQCDLPPSGAEQGVTTLLLHRDEVSACF